MAGKNFREEFESDAKARGINDPGYYDALLKIASRVQSHRDLKKEAFTIGIGGAQGSGKSTLAELLAIVLVKVFKLSVAVLSLDDFYKTKQERQKMAAEIHPLFSVRGVPGTHDMKLMNSVVKNLKAGKKAEHPCFNKADDDRFADWKTIEPAEVLILEGWCWGASPQGEEVLVVAVNDLERDRDAGGIWRRKVNEVLGKDEYQQAFDNDLQIFLAVPGMEAVYRWRLQQEQGLQAGSGVMNETGIREFIMFYERITRDMLKDCPSNADFTIVLNETHQIESQQSPNQPEA